MRSPQLFRYGLRSKRLVLYALVKGLDDAVRSNDGSSADRYRRRLGLIADHFDTNPAVGEALKRLLWVSDRWLATDVVEHDDNKEQLLELTEHLMELLSSPAAS